MAVVSLVREREVGEGLLGRCFGDDWFEMDWLHLRAFTIANGLSENG